MSNMANAVLPKGQVDRRNRCMPRYDPATYFVMSIDLPAVGTVHAAESGAPYLAVSLTLDPVVLTTLLADLSKPIGQYEHLSLIHI